jgi:ribulose-phosphate 3-epimerase
VGKVLIAPSLLSADFSKLLDEIKEVEEAGADLLHVDVMDGHFVPNITIGPFIVRTIKNSTKLPLDVHLMIENPEEYVETFVQAGADYVSVHPEATYHLHRLLEKIRDLGAKPGVALNPATPLNVLAYILDEVDYILVMSVNPGFGGQEFIPQTVSKIKHLKEVLKRRGYEIPIEVDGGINSANAGEVVKAGAEILVAGYAIFGADDRKKALLDIREAAEK